MAYLTRSELLKLDLLSLGDDVLVSEHCALHGTECMRIGDNVRIDDFVVITAREELRIGSHVHVGAQVFVAGAWGVEIGDFSGLSPGVAVFSATDDFSGASLTGPTVPERYRAVRSGPVLIGRHVVVGAQSVILPGVRLGDGVAVGALSLVDRSLDAWTIYGGVPARALKERSREALRLEGELLREEGVGE